MSEWVRDWLDAMILNISTDSNLDYFYKHVQV